MGRLDRIALLFSYCVAVGLVMAGCGEDERRPLTLGVPTTVQDSGLLDALLPEFGRMHPEYRVRFVAAGSGELLALGAQARLVTTESREVVDHLVADHPFHGPQPEGATAGDQELRQLEGLLREPAVLETTLVVSLQRNAGHAR